MAKTVPNFGQIYKANAAGYKWTPEYRLFVRILPAGGFFKVEIEPPTFNPSAQVPVLLAAPAAAWHSQDGILDYAKVLNKYMGRSTHHTFYMDEDGFEIPPQTIVEPVSGINVKILPSEDKLKSIKEGPNRAGDVGSPEDIDPAFKGTE